MISDNYEIEDLSGISPKDRGRHTQVGETTHKTDEKLDKSDQDLSEPIDSERSYVIDSHSNDHVS